MSRLALRNHSGRKASPPRHVEKQARVPFQALAQSSRRAVPQVRESHFRTRPPLLQIHQTTSDAIAPVVAAEIITPWEAQPLRHQFAGTQR
jgi:hypothetical protein